jgi:hypothetical protein
VRAACGPGSPPALDLDLLRWATSRWCTHKQDILVFNGEIYNFQELRSRHQGHGVVFRGHSDTEVLLHALVEWGTDAIAGLAGMFAFAFFHKRTRRLLLARGPLGIKPLYVSHSADRLIVASEVRGVLASGMVDPRVDRRGVAGLLAYGAVQEPFTFFEDISSFPAGSYQWFDLSANGAAKAGTPMRHWTYPGVDDSITEAQAKERVDFELTRSVREHLIADVPVGVFLSSGVDSTVMAGLARQVSPHVRTFTLGFLDQPDLSESDMARTSARELCVEHHDIQVTSANALTLTQRWLDTLDQPSVDGLNTYIISKAVRDAGIIVAISGLGGDELFGGYPSFGELPRIHRFLQRVQWMSPAARGQLMHTLGIGKPASVRIKMDGPRRPRPPPPVPPPPHQAQRCLQRLGSAGRWPRRVLPAPRVVDRVCIRRRRDRRHLPVRVRVLYEEHASAISTRRAWLTPLEIRVLSSTASSISPTPSPDASACPAHAPTSTSSAPLSRDTSARSSWVRRNAASRSPSAAG